jgi:hypothetical protein
MPGPRPPTAVPRRRTVVLTASAARHLLRLVPDEQLAIATQIDAYATSGQGRVVQLVGSRFAHMRVGSWRVTFREADDRIIVIQITPLLTAGDQG